MDILLQVKNDNLVELKKYMQYNSLSIVDENNRGLLHYAAYGRALVCINILIDSGVDKELKDNKGQTAIFDAAIKGNLGVLKILIRKQCNVNIQDEFANTPLFYAIKTNNRAVVDVLFDNSDLSFRNNNNENALLIAIKYNYHNINKFIKDINVSNDIGDTVMHYAVKYNNFELVKKYISRFNVNKKNNNNETVFYYAVRYSNRDIVRYLLKLLPVVDIKNKFSENLLDNVSKNHYLINDLIENYLSSLEFIYYKQQNNHIYKYLCTNEKVSISKVLLNKKDNFSLSLLDYIDFDEN